LSNELIIQISRKLSLHYKISVIGRVQGVWFRKYTREAALSRGIKGFVENSEDGSVYLEAEGSSDDMDQFLEWLHRGSPMSRVEKVIRKEGQLVGFATFEIRR
jgi:acylphosphatase